MAKAMLLTTLILLASLLLNSPSIAKENPSENLTNLYAEAYKLKDARDFVAQVINGIEKGALLYIKTDSKSVKYIFADRNMVIRSAALAAITGTTTEEQAGKTLAGFENDSEREVLHLKSILKKLDKEINEKRDHIIALEKAAKKGNKRGKQSKESKPGNPPRTPKAEIKRRASSSVEPDTKVETKDKVDEAEKGALTPDLPRLNYPGIEPDLKSPYTTH